MSCSLVYRENILSREHIPYVENTFYTGRQHTWAAAKTAAAEFTKKLEAEKAKFEEEMRAAVEAQEALKRQLLVKQEEERRRLEEEMRRDTEAFEEKMKAEQERKLKALEEKKKQMEEDMSKQAEHSTQEERKMLIDLHEKKLSQMEQVCPRFKAFAAFSPLCP